MRGGGGGSPGRARAHQVRDTPCNRRRRIEPGHRPRRTGAEAFEQQRIMRAGQHDRVGAPAVFLDETAGDFCCDRPVGDRCAGKFGLGISGEPRRADQMHVAAGREFADQRARIFASDSRLCAEHSHPLGHRLRAGGLDRRHRANERDAKLRAQFSERKRRGGVAGDDNQIGFVFADRVDRARRRCARSACLRLGVRRESRRRPPDRYSARRAAPA